MLTKSLAQLSVPEKILLAEELWDVVSSRPVKVTKDEIDYVKERLAKIKSDGKKSDWSKVRRRVLA